jgi:hypothetical protein
VVVGLVGVQLARLAAGSAAAGAGRGDGVQQRKQQLRVGGVRGGDEDAEGDPAPVAQDVDL